MQSVYVVLSMENWEYEDLNHIATRALVGRETAVIVKPEGAYLKEGDGWTLISIPFVDREGEERSFSAFREGGSEEAWDELARM